MKKFLATFSMVALLFAFASAQTAATETTKSVSGPVMTFEKSDMDYGTIAQGADPLRKFKFKNTGTEPLVIKNARGSCGCTVPEFTKIPIKPGRTGDIKVSFDSTGKPGQQSKNVTVTANIPNGSEILTIKTNVTPKKVEQATSATTMPMPAPTSHTKN